MSGGPASVRTGAPATGDAAAPATPNSDSDSFLSGSEDFATPRSSAQPASDRTSFKSARGAAATPSEASFRTPGASVAGGSRLTHQTSAVSAKSGHSGGDTPSVATSASRHESALEYPAAFRPTIPSDGGSSEAGSAHSLPRASPGAPASAPPASLPGVDTAPRGAVSLPPPSIGGATASRPASHAGSTAGSARTKGRFGQLRY